MAFWQWSKTPANNATADPTINWAEGMPPGAVNDSARAEMARLADFRDDQAGSLTTSGTSTAYTVATNQGFDTLAHLDGMKITIVFHTTSGSSPTLSVDSLTAKPLRLATGAAPPDGCFIEGTPYTLTYYNTAGEFLQDGAAIFIADGSVVNAQLADVAAWTLKGNNSASSGAPSDFTIDSLTAKTSPTSSDEALIWDAATSGMAKATIAAIQGALSFPAPTVQRFTSGSSATYTPTSGAVRIRVRMVGGGGGGGGILAGNGSNGTQSSFGSWTALPGQGGTIGGPGGGSGGLGGSGGANGSGTLITRVGGGGGSGGAAINGTVGGAGGANAFGGQSGGWGLSGGITPAPATNSGAGGSGAAASSVNGAGGGGAGEYVEFYVTSPSATTYTIGTGGAGGSSSVNGITGAAGIIIIEEFYI